MIGAIGSTDFLMKHTRRASDQFIVDYTVAHVPITAGLGLRGWHGILMMLAWCVPAAEVRLISPLTCQGRRTPSRHALCALLQGAPERIVV